MYAKMGGGGLRKVSGQEMKKTLEFEKSISFLI